MKKYSGFLLSSSILILLNGCTSQYTYNDFNVLPVAGQVELCQDWFDTVSKTKSFTTYYSEGELSTSDAMAMDAANAGAALKEHNFRTARKNLRNCSPRHLSIGLPEGSSTFFVNRDEKAVVISSEVDQLNIDAAKLVLSGNYYKAMDLTTQAINKQKNPYSFEIHGVASILAAKNEKNMGKRMKLYQKSVDSFSASERPSGFSSKGIEYQKEGDLKFLLWYAYYLSNQNQKAWRTLSFDAPFFEIEANIYKGLLACIEPNIRYKTTVDYCKDENKHYGEYCNGVDIIQRAKLDFENSAKYTSPQPWLKESIEKVEKICTGDRLLEKQMSKKHLELPSESLLKYLDQVDFRGFADVTYVAKRQLDSLRKETVREPSFGQSNPKASNGQSGPDVWKNISGMGPFKEGFSIVWIAWGSHDRTKSVFIDKTGKIAFKPFDDAKFFSEGLAAVKLNGKWGYINHKGNYVIKPIYDEAHSFSDGLARVESWGKWGFINKKGQYVIKPQFNSYSVRNFSEGLAAARRDIGEKWGYINTSGKFVIAPQYSDAKEFIDSLAVVSIKKGEKEIDGVIDLKGRYVIEPKFYSILGKFYNNSVCAILEEGGDRVFIDKNGKVISKTGEKVYCGFSEGLQAVSNSSSGKTGYINEAGKYVIKPSFDGYASYFSSGLASVKRDGKYYYIGKDGKVRLELEKKSCDPDNIKPGENCYIFKRPKETKKVRVDK